MPGVFSRSCHARGRHQGLQRSRVRITLRPHNGWQRLPALVRNATNPRVWRLDRPAGQGEPGGSERWNAAGAGTGAIAVRSGSSRAHWWVPRRVFCSVGSRPEAARGEIRHDRQRADPLCRAIVARLASVVHSQPQRESVAAERKQLNAIATSSIPREFHESIMTGDISGHTCLRFSVLTLLP